ncbi:MAG: hypothetical protein WDN23_16110 [Edaphobacter sp.]
MAFVLALCGHPAIAQFSGPALGISTPVNPPVVITTDPAILYPASREVYLEEAICWRCIYTEAWTMPYRACGDRWDGSTSID